MTLTLNWYICIANAHLMMLSLLSLDLSRNNNGWWSVSRMNSLPYRYMCRRFVTYARPIPSRFIEEYFSLPFFSFRLMYMTCIFISACPCNKTAPMPWFEAFVVKMKGLSNAGSPKTGCLDIASLSISHACIDSLSQEITFGSPFLVLSVSGLAMLSKFHTNFLW